MGRKVSKLGKNKLRVIKLPKQAIYEMLWEHFMDCHDEVLDLKPDSTDTICSMKLADDFSELVFYACDLPKKGAPDFDRFDRYIEKNVGFTANSLYTDGVSKKDRYQTVTVPEEE